MISTPWKVALTLVFTAATIFLAARSGALDTLEATFTQIGCIELITLLTLFGIMRILQAWSLIKALKVLDSSLQFRSSLELAGFKGFYNLGLGGAGFVAQAVHARSRNLFSVSQLAFASVSQSLFLVSALGTLLLAFAVSLLEHRTAFWSLLAVGALAALAPLVAIRSFYHAGAVSILLPRSLRAKLAALKESLPTPQVDQLVSLWLVQIGLVSVRLARVVVIALFLDPIASIEQLAAITLFADLATVVPLTPGGIGIREFLIGAGASLGKHSELFVAAAIVDRGITISGNLAHGFGTIAMAYSKQPN